MTSITPVPGTLRRTALIGLVFIVLTGALLSCNWPTVSPTAAIHQGTPRPYPTSTVGEDPTYTEARYRMVNEQLRTKGISDPAVLAAMEMVPRHLFILPESMQQAYADHPLPIGYGQTISSPYIVAWMSELLRLKPGDKVLEIGTGSGYQAAILEYMGMEVYTIEIVEPLATQAAARLSGLGYKNLVVRNADGYYGWIEHAPFDAIIVTCAPDHIPPALVAQLADGGRMVLPVGPPGLYQTLWLVEKQGDQVKTTNEGGVRFVPLLRQ
ncbi:MAG: protein-L-isoaspartate(D-aspartate) O-methyltransferase [Anaerolineae bacterium]